MTAPVTDSAVIERIEATLFVALYRARRRARRQLLGLTAPPTPNPDALARLRAARQEAHR